MVSLLRSAPSLLLGMTVLVLGNGVVSTMVALRVASSHWSSAWGGALGGLILGAYFAGLTLGALAAPRLLERVGHIRAFAAFAVVVSVGSLLLPLWLDAFVWLLIRVVMGFAMVGLFMVIESWLNTRAEAASRGVLLAIYMVLVQLAYSAAQPLMLLYGPTRLESFMLASVLVGLGAIPVALTRVPQPDPLPFVSYGLRSLLRDVPLAAVGCFGAGAANGLLLATAPVWATLLAFDTTTIATFMAALLAAGIVLQLPLGRLSDRMDRRVVLGAAALALALVSLALMALRPTLPWHLYAIAVALGSFVFVLYPLAIAHANDYLSNEQRVPASGSLLLAFGVGASIGPAAASVVMTSALGQAGFAFCLLLTSASTAVFAFYRRTRREAVPAAEQSHFVPVTLPQALATSELNPEIDNLEGAHVGEEESSHQG